MLGEDSPDLGDDLGMTLTEVASRDDFLGGGGVEMGTGVPHQAVGPIGRWRHGEDGDDGVGLHHRRSGELGDTRQER